MGNCNFKAEKDKDSVNGRLIYIIINLPLLINTLYSYIEEPVLISLCNWEGGFWKSVACGEEKGERDIRYEGDVQGESHGEEKRSKCHE